MATDSRPVNWTIKIYNRQLYERSCVHESSGVEAPGCRSCSVNWAVKRCGMKLSMADIPGEEARVVSGRTENEEQKIALTRLIAWANNHPEPLTMFAMREQERRLQHAKSNT